MELVAPVATRTEVVVVPFTVRVLVVLFQVKLGLAAKVPPLLHCTCVSAPASSGTISSIVSTTDEVTIAVRGYLSTVTEE